MAACATFNGSLTLASKKTSCVKQQNVRFPLKAAARRTVIRSAADGYELRVRNMLWTPTSSRPEADFSKSVDSNTAVTSAMAGTPTRAGGRAPPPPYVAQAMNDVLGQLFHQRIVRLGGAVDDDMANLIVAQLLYLNSSDPKKVSGAGLHKHSALTFPQLSAAQIVSSSLRSFHFSPGRHERSESAIVSLQDISIYVNSPGGSVTAGMAIFDTMRYVSPDCSTTCVGLAASMGTCSLQCSSLFADSGSQGEALHVASLQDHDPSGICYGGLGGTLYPVDHHLFDSSSELTLVVLRERLA
eukprot:1085530-Prorocentrum_minimum.AAC.1